MGPSSPLRNLHAQAPAGFTSYPPADSVFAPDAERTGVVASFGDVDAEYRALREGAGLLDAAHRRILITTGPERIEFLNRMLTQELKDLPHWRAADSFWLNRKGRIDADIRLLHLPEETWLIVDTAAAHRTLETLSSFIIMEDVELRDTSDAWSTLEIVGPRALAMLESAAPDAADLIRELPLNGVARLKLAGAEVVVDRSVVAAVTCLWIHVPGTAITDVYQRLSEVGDANSSKHGFSAIGFDAMNRARIEAGQPAYLIDFGPQSLPHESGILNQRVSFKKGCYLGQEVVARMQSLGQPKQKVVSLQFESNDAPQVGAKLFPLAPDASEVGVITSAVHSPRLGAAVAFGQVRTKFALDGNQLRTESGARCVIAARRSPTQSA